jgi:hypothetical protein
LDWFFFRIRIGFSFGFGLVFLSDSDWFSTGLSDLGVQGILDLK